MTEKELLEKGYRKYEGEKIDVFFNSKMCAHSGKCVQGLPSVFDVNRKPWILLEGSDVEEVKEVIKICPSGALQYIEKE